MDRQPETCRLIDTMSEALHNKNPSVDPMQLLQAATDLVAAQPDASIEEVWRVAEHLARTLH